MRARRGVEALTAMDAVVASKKRDHDEVRTVREHTSARLHDTEIVTLSMCRVTGQPQGLTEVCDARLHRWQPDVDCFVAFMPMDLIVGGCRRTRSPRRWPCLARHVSEGVHGVGVEQYEQRLHRLSMMSRRCAVTPGGDGRSEARELGGHG